MIKCINKRGTTVLIKTKGTSYSLTVESLGIIHNLYEIFYKQNPELAEKFKKSIIKGMTDPDSPVWKVGTND